VTAVSFEELKERFGPVQDVPKYGQCVVVQGPDFDPDWEVFLGDAGYSCVFDTFGGSPVVFVPLKKTVGPAPIAGTRVNRSAQEDAYLLELWNSGLSVAQISVSVAEKFPVRVGNAVKMRLDRLKATGKIQSRQKHFGNEVKKMENENKKNAFNGEVWLGSEDDLLVSLWKQLPRLLDYKKDFWRNRK
jgi:hypothetical protein